MADFPAGSQESGSEGRATLERRASGSIKLREFVWERKFIITVFYFLLNKTFGELFFSQQKNKMLWWP